MEELQCPNCGQRMVPFRLDRQRAGRRTVELRWSICEGCRHVGLTNWQYEDTPVAEPTIETERVPRKERSPRTGTTRLHAFGHVAMRGE